MEPVAGRLQGCAELDSQGTEAYYHPTGRQGEVMQRSTLDMGNSGLMTLSFQTATRSITSQVHFDYRKSRCPMKLEPLCSCTQNDVSWFWCRMSLGVSGKDWSG